MRLIWFFILFTSSCWLYFTSTFSPQITEFKIPFLYPFFFSLLIASICFRKIDDFCISHKSIIYIIPLILIRLFIPFPYSFGAIVIISGIIVGLISNRVKFLNCLTNGIILTGIILLIQSIQTPLFYVISSRVHEIKIINDIVYPFIKFLGLKIGYSESIIYIPNFGDIIPVPSTLEKTGFFLMLYIYSSAIVLFLIFDRNYIKILLFTFYSIIYTLFRYIVLIFILAQVKSARIFWESFYQTLSFVPFVIILSLILPIGEFKSIKFKIPCPVFTKKGILCSCLFFISFFSLTGFLGFHDPGLMKNGRILVDDKHSDWEWSTDKFDTKVFGSQSTYNYYCMIDYLNNFYKVSVNQEKDLSEDLLNNYDCLILKTPTSEYKKDEIEDIIKFVENGGGLWLIGDHTNIFGMNYYLNFIAKRFGLFFHYDSTYDLTTGKLTYYKKPKVFPHPSLIHMPPFLFATSCSIDSPFFSENVMIGYSLRTRLLSYSERGFFEQKTSQDYEFGLFLQSDGIKYGKGRVMAFSDSTCFSNFYMFIPGKPELVIDTIEWLNRTNYWSLNNYFIMIFILCLFLGVFISFNNCDMLWGNLYFFGLCAAAVGIFFFTWFTQITYPLPEPKKNYNKAIFETQYSNICLPVKELVDNKPDNYHTFYVWTQRMGYVPSLHESLPENLENNELLIIINPIKSFFNEDIEKIISFVNNGGALLILDDPENSNSTSNELLKFFKIKIDFNKISNSILFHDNNIIGISENSGTVIGGEPLLKTKDNKAVCSIVKKGKGKVIAMANSIIFSNSKMGGTQIAPDKKRQQIYNTEFFILEKILLIHNRL